jgi:cytidylate kinase
LWQTIKEVAMAVDMGGVKYIPGMHTRPRPAASQLADQFIREWDQRRLEAKTEEGAEEIPPTICFSRKIGVGALEVADLLATKLNYRVADREVLDHIATHADLSDQTVRMFDERYPGRIKELFALAFGEKSFIKSDYTRHLFGAVLAIAGMQPTIFVGRGAHLILPRHRVLAVRFISSRDTRIKRLAEVLHVEIREVERKLDQVDNEQRDFFKRVYGKKDASPYEFDLLINCDFMTDPAWSADIVAEAFEKKFLLNE